MASIAIIFRFFGLGFSNKAIKVFDLSLFIKGFSFKNTVFDNFF